MRASMRRRCLGAMSLPLKDDEKVFDEFLADF